MAYDNEIMPKLGDISDDDCDDRLSLISDDYMSIATQYKENLNDYDDCKSLIAEKK